MAACCAMSGLGPDHVHALVQRYVALHPIRLKPALAEAGPALYTTAVCEASP